MEEKVLLHVAAAFESNRRCLSDSQSYFLMKKVKMLIQKVYGYYLHEYVGMMQEKQLAEFDSQLYLISPEFHQSVDEAVLYGRIFNFHYIHEWRKRNTRKTFKFNLFDIYCNLRRSLRK